MPKPGKNNIRGIQFLINDHGRKTAVVIDFKFHATLWEDIQNVLISRLLHIGSNTSLAKVKASLVATGKLRG